VVDEDDAPDPESVMTAFGLEGPLTAWTVVRGAWSNRVFRLGAGGRAFAVKEMRNPWGDPRWEEWLAQSWSFELLAIGAGVVAPAPLANPADGGCLARVSCGGGTGAFVPVRVHRWVDGQPLGPGVVAPECARWAGQVLAALHGLGVRPHDRSMFPVLSTDSAGRWPELTDAAHRGGAEWAPLMTAAASSVTVIAELARSCGIRPGDEVMSHGDIDQKNLISARSGPVLCDWDLAAPLVPLRELADVAMSLACWQDFAIARAVVGAYRADGGNDTEITPPDLGQPMMTGLDWAAFNVARALGLRPASPADAALARDLLPALLAAIPGQVATALRITDILRI
jgi:aminoglycoside phosphotransferase (APT) family kinase protein